MKIAYNLHENILTYLIFSYKNSLYIRTFMVSFNALSAQLNYLSKRFAM